MHKYKKRQNSLVPNYNRLRIDKKLQLGLNLQPLEEKKFKMKEKMSKNNQFKDFKMSINKMVKRQNANGQYVNPD